MREVRKSVLLVVEARMTDIVDIAGEGDTTGI